MRKSVSYGAVLKKPVKGIEGPGGGTGGISGQDTSGIVGEDSCGISPSTETGV